MTTWQLLTECMQFPAETLRFLRGPVMQMRDDPAAACHSTTGCPGGWYCFDDERVDPWDISNLAKDCFGGKYMLPDLGQGLLKSQVLCSALTPLCI